MNDILFYIPFLIAYLLGAIPSSIIIGKTFYNKDVRTEGSGNAGATNTFRVLGKKAGSIVLFMDILKGALATVAFLPFGLDYSIEFKLLLGLTAVIGHIYPVFLGFKGGKGVATLLGMMIGIHPIASLICIVIFLFSLTASRYVSLSSIISTLAFPILVTFVLKEDNLSLQIFGVAVFLLVSYTHRSNIQRLLKGEENKTYLFGKPEEK